jgi:hypothetical protein
MTTTTTRNHLIRNLLLASAVSIFIWGCASDDEAAKQTTDDLTADEASAGSEWQKSGASEEATGGEEHAAPELDDPAVLNDANGELAEEEEDSTPFLLPNDGLNDADAMAIDGEPIPKLDDAEIKATKSCRKANGYRSGRRFTICITTVNGKRVEVNTARAYLRMRKKAAGKGIYLYVVSGFRTMAEQRYLYRCYKTGSCNGGNLAAPPGYSNHQSGHALDLNTSARGVYWFLSKYGSSYGFRRTVPSEAWHWERW